MSSTAEQFIPITNWYDTSNGIEISMKTIEKFPKRLKILRELHDYTQEYIAFSLGITQSAYSKVEKGGTPISFDRIMKIINVYQITFNDFLEFDLGKIIKSKNIIL